MLVSNVAELSPEEVKSSKWSDISNNEILLQWASNIRIQLSVFISYKEDIISLKRKMFWSWYAEQVHLAPSI